MLKYLFFLLLGEIVDNAKMRPQFFCRLALDLVSQISAGVFQHAFNVQIVGRLQQWSYGFFFPFDHYMTRLTMMIS